MTDRIRRTQSEKSGQSRGLANILNPTDEDSGRNEDHERWYMSTAEANAERSKSSGPFQPIEGVTAIYTMSEMAQSLPSRPGSPRKRQYSLAAQSEPSHSSALSASSSRRLAHASSRRMTSSRSSSPGKMSTGTARSRNASPEKGKGGNMTLRRSTMRSCEPPFIFGHKHYLLSGKPLPKKVTEMRRRLNPERLLDGCLNESCKTALEDAYPEEFFRDSIFSCEPKTNRRLLQHVRKLSLAGNKIFMKDGDENEWSWFVKSLLEGVPLDGDDIELEEEKALLVTAAQSRFLSERVTPLSAPNLKSDILVEANPDFPSAFRTARDRNLRPDAEIEESFSPTTHRSSEYNPAVCVIEVKAEGGDFQEAQTQAAVVGTAILMKARAVGADRELLPCVPAFITVGHVWHLNLIYDEPEKGIVIAGPWVIGDTITLLGTLQVVLVIEELRDYATKDWWPSFVNEACTSRLVGTTQSSG